MSEPALALNQVVRTFDQGDDGRLEVLRGASLAIMPGEMVALVGPSGAGKSTLLHAAGLLEPPQSGEVLINGESCGGLDDAQRTLLRRSKLGFVYQSHHLLPEFSARENVILPQMIAGVSRHDAGLRADELLASVGLSARANHRPGKMSGGEQQRVAIVRALANNPAILIADEPTGNLDPDTADGVFEQLLALVRDKKLAALMATHNMALAARMDRTLSLQNGQISSTET
ncbi:MAG: ABC transporter ATP-binding protein [Alphaproteobacteria bacterium]|nr:ABC transporter ATP-binding protein [Alphaproteobacteria bacterium]